MPVYITLQVPGETSSSVQDSFPARTVMLCVKRKKAQRDREREIGEMISRAGSSLETKVQQSPLKRRFQTHEDKRRCGGGGSFGGGC